MKDEHHHTGLMGWKGINICPNRCEEVRRGRVDVTLMSALLKIKKTHQPSVVVSKQGRSSEESADMKGEAGFAA